MAQTTKSSSKRSSAGGGTKAKGNGSSPATKAKRASSKTTKSAGRARKTASKTAKPEIPDSPAAAARQAASAGTKAAGKAVGAAVAKAKKPLAVGGAAAIGVAGGLVLRDRVSQSRSQMLTKRIKRVSLPKPPKNVDLDALKKIDFDKVSKAAERVGNYGRQVDEVASAVQRASEKAKKGK
jgi:hypothetical protein